MNSIDLFEVSQPESKRRSRRGCREVLDEGLQENLRSRPPFPDGPPEDAYGKQRRTNPPKTTARAASIPPSAASKSNAATHAPYARKIRDVRVAVR